VAAPAIAAVVGIDLALSLAVPPPRFPEAEDGIARFEASDPSVLVLGSSHLRTFESVADELSARTGGARTLVPVPVDWGKMASYRWTWEHRLRPLVEARDASGAPRHPALRQVILVTQWWDFRNLGADDTPLVNLPARAWTFGDWLADAWHNGVTPYNQAYVLHRFSRLFPGSALVQFRGRTALLDHFKALIWPDAARVAVRQCYGDRLRHFRQYTERGGDRLFDPADVEALDALLTDFRAHGLDVTVLAYPRMHGMITDRARESPLGRFSTFLAERCAAHGVRLVDLTWDHPLSDADFGDDLDHPTGEASGRFAAWALDGVLRFLLDPPASTAAPAPKGGNP